MGDDGRNERDVSEYGCIALCTVPYELKVVYQRETQPTTTTQFFVGKSPKKLNEVHNQSSNHPPTPHTMEAVEAVEAVDAVDAEEAAKREKDKETGQDNIMFGDMITLPDGTVQIRIRKEDLYKLQSSHLVPNTKTAEATAEKTAT